MHYYPEQIKSTCYPVRAPSCQSPCPYAARRVRRHELFWRALQSLPAAGARPRARTSGGCGGGHAAGSLSHPAHSLYRWNQGQRRARLPRTSKQLAVCKVGTCTPHLGNSTRPVSFRLNSLAKYLLTGSMIWRKMLDFTDICVLLVRAVMRRIIPAVRHSL
ncbi:WxcM-like domain-containing protein [Sphingomonas sp. Mn802worker]|uniref:WxcM-like domain-containing protein n=1 Tax=Sphingomonas sp. Mn802worker TaxID=629773 RepID=UPI000A07A044